MKRILLLWAVGVVASVAMCADLAFDETNAEIFVNPHTEYKGASARVTKEGADWKLHYDFSGGGHGVGLKVRPRTPFSADRICFEARHGQGHKMAVLIEDSAGQFFFRYAEPQPFRWCPFECDLAARWPIHWGGANDGVVRQPIVSFEVSIDRTTKGTPVADDVGDVLIRNIAARTVPPPPEATGTPVRYLVSDFTSGDRFSGMPRRFYRDDAPLIAVTNGEFEVDFAARDGMSLIHEIPVWGCPERLHLTVDAPADAAGLSFTVGYRAGGDEKTLQFGNLPSAEMDADHIRHELSVPVPASTAKSRRIMRVTVRRGTALAKKIKVRLLKLEASVRPGVDLPPLLATPPTGTEPPRELEVAYLNLGSQTTEGCSVVVRTTDWQGHELGLSVVPLPPVGPGARAVVRARVPSVTDKLYFASYSCLLVRGAARVDETPGWTTSWTRPLADAGDAERRPDLPWGFGVYLHRTEDLFAYFSGYAVLTNEAALAVMEKKAELAQAMGVKWERAEFQPHVICREKGVFDFSFYDRLVDCAERHGISLYVVFSHYWPMRGKRRFDQHDKTAYTPENYTNWVETLRVSAERYRGRIAGWEIWNEPNWTFWDGPKEDYAKLVSMSYPAVKAADPVARVLACSTCGIDLDFIDRCIRDGARFDDITIHPYRSDPDERGFLSELAAVTNRSHGTKTWLTELGWPTGCDSKTYSERQQAAYLARAYLAAAGSGCCAAINGYDFFDDGFNVLERENNFGIVRRDGTPKPAYRALAKVFRFFTRGRPSIMHQRMSDGTLVWIFRMGGRSAVWSDLGRPLRVTTVNEATARNLMDETLVSGSDMVVFTGPLDVILFDSNVRTVEELPLDVRGEEKVGRRVF